MKIKLGKKTELGKLKSGSLFLFGGVIALKSEYRSNGQSDAYIVGTGEYFWGGAKSPMERERLEVRILKIK